MFWNGLVAVREGRGVVLEAANGRLAGGGRSFSTFWPRKSRLKKIMEEVIKLEKIMTASPAAFFAVPVGSFLPPRPPADPQQTGHNDRKQAPAGHADRERR